MKRRPRVTIRDVAAAARVSMTTVSHVLSSNRQVAEGTAARVRKVVEKLGYTPGYAARTLQSGSTRVIGLLVPDLTNHFFAALAAGVESAAHRWGYSVVLGNTQFDAERERRYLHMIRQRSIDALIYAAGAPPDPDELRRVAQGFPLALVDEAIEGVPAVTAVADHRTGGELVGRHLRRLGHRRVLVIAGPPDLPSSQARLDGFRDHCGADIVLHPGDYRESSGHAAVMAQAAREPSPPYTAIFALNDLMALGAMAALRSLGRRVPQEVSVVGFDDIPTAALMNPTLTTVRQPAYRIGETAADELLRPLASGRRPKPTHHVLPVQLVERESSAHTAAAVSPRKAQARR